MGIILGRYSCSSVCKLETNYTKLERDSMLPTLKLQTKELILLTSAIFSADITSLNVPQHLEFQEPATVSSKMDQRIR